VDETTTERLSVRRPEDGSLVGWFGSLFNLKLTGQGTGGSHSLVEIIEPPGAASPVHVHHGEDETVYVLEGEYTVRCGGLETVATAGTVAFMPRGIPHSLQVAGDSNARALLLFTPGGFEGFFREAGEPTEKRELPAPVPPDPKRLAEIGQRYALDIVGPPPGH
jgi:quercetin dioxygenase-like cupin family protein